MSTGVSLVESMVEAPSKNGKAKTKLRRVAILGTASPSIRHYPEESSTGWELWGMVKSALHRELRRGEGCSLYFEPHERTLWDNKTKDYQKVTVPILMQQVFEDVPMSREYPLERVLTEIPSQIYGRRKDAPKGAHRSTIAYMIAYAIIELGPQHHKPKDQRDKIGLWGVEMSAEGEYGYQKPNCEALLGYAMGLGIDVYLPESTTLLKGAGAYGYEKRALNNGIITYERLFKEQQEIEKNLVRASRAMAGAEGLTEWIGRYGQLKFQEDWMTLLVAHQFKWENEEAKEKFLAETNLTKSTPATLGWLWEQYKEYERQRLEQGRVIANMEGQLHTRKEYSHLMDTIDRGAPTRT